MYVTLSMLKKVVHTHTYVRNLKMTVDYTVETVRMKHSVVHQVRLQVRPQFPIRISPADPLLKGNWGLTCVMENWDLLRWTTMWPVSGWESRTDIHFKNHKSPTGSQHSI